jgi:DNA-binding CsgD family transcriptional regulator
VGAGRLTVSRAEFADHLRAVHDARGRLAGASLAELLVRAPGEACRACGFSRATLALVRDGVLVVAGVADDEHPDVAADFMRLARTLRPRLADCLLESDVVASRRAELVADAGGDPRVFRPLIGVARSPAFVVAPLVHADRVLALLYADRRAGPPPDALDRELLAVFATAVAPLMHHATLAAIARSGEPPPPEPPPAAALTPREAEVLSLMADGASNAAIAERLVVSETTVKSHVRHILRKLGAANRTEAVGRYARLAG